MAHPKKILVVDNDVEFILLLETRLRRGGYEVTVAHSGEEAQSLAATSRPDLILMDLDMPHLSGDIVALRIKSQNGNEKIPIVALTGHGDDLTRATTRAMGFADHIVKPYEPEDLFKRIKKILEPPDLTETLQTESAERKQVEEGSKTQSESKTRELTCPGKDLEATDPPYQELLDHQKAQENQNSLMDLQAELQSKAEEVARLTESLQLESTEKEKLSATTQTLGKELAGLQTELQQKIQELTQLNSALQNESTERKRLEGAFTASTQANETLQSSFEELKAELQSKAEELANRCQSEEILRKAYEELQKELFESTQANETLQQSSSELKKELQAKIEDITRLTESLQLESTEKKKLSIAIQALEQQLAQLKTEFQQKIQELTQLNSALQSESTERKRLEGAFTESTQTNETLQKELAESRQSEEALCNFFKALKQLEAKVERVAKRREKKPPEDIS